MRKLTPIANDPITFINSVINGTKKRKDNEHQFKERCETLFTTHKDYVEKYKTEFDKDSIENLIGMHPNLTKTEKEELGSLYSYKKKQIKELRYQVLTENGYLNEFCPLCGVNLVNSMDHFIPQEDYPLFVVHPLNLIPCCMICNGRKSDIVMKNGTRKYWNVYIDTPPKDEYLKCNVKIGLGGIIDVDFRLEQGNIPTRQFRLLEHTMGKYGQKVLLVYKAASGKFINNFIKKAIKYIRNNSPKKKFGDCIQDLIEVVESDFEPNDCECVIKRALINSPIFHDNLKDILAKENVPFTE